MKKYNLLIPIAGKGQRFVDENYIMPKQLIMVKGTQMIDKSLQCINKEDCNLIFAVRKDHISNYSIDEILKKRFGEDIKIVVIDRITDGSVSTCLLAEKYINNNLPLFIYTLDVFFQPVFDPGTVNFKDGLILTFKSNSPYYSYAEVGKNEYVTRTAEKEAISEHASVGIYGFKKGKDFVKYAKQMIKKNIRTNGEFYICPLYNLLIKDKKKISVYDVNKMHVMGTPKELKFFEKIASNNIDTHSKIALCCDHSGFVQKEFMKRLLKQYNIGCVDFGTYVNKDCDQVDYTKLACQSIQSGECTHGFGFCKSGQAVNIAANKHKDILATLIYDVPSVEYAIRHNGTNFFSISTSKIDTNEQLEDVLDLMLTTSFDGGRHQIRVQKIMEI